MDRPVDVLETAPDRGGEPLHPEVTALLCQRAHHVLGLLLPTEAATRPNLPGCEGGDRRREIHRVPALPVQTENPLPGDRNHLGDRFLLAVVTPYGAEKDAGAPVQPGGAGGERRA